MSPDPSDSAASIRSQYSRRDVEEDSHRYSLFNLAALQAHQERTRALLALWRRHGVASLAGRRIVEVGCGTGGNLIDLLRMGASPELLTGIELLPERAEAARRCLPPAVALLQADAAVVPIQPSSQDMVVAFTVFSSILDDASQDRLAELMWRWARPGGGIVWYDFAVDNPRNQDVRGISMRRLKTLFPGARMEVRRITLAPPLARILARVHPALVAAVGTCLPILKTHRLVYAMKP